MAEEKKAGKEKNATLKKEIQNSAEMTIRLNGDGTIQYVEGGGHSGRVDHAEFDFEDFYLDHLDYEGGVVKECLDIKAMTVHILRITDKDGKNPKIVKYIWESSRHWW